MDDRNTGPGNEPFCGMSGDMADLFLAGIIIEHDPDSAEWWGAFEETALDEAAAWDANGDLDLSQA
jgi:hypothetical protein